MTQKQGEAVTLPPLLQIQGLDPAEESRCGRVSGRHAGGNAHGPLPSGCFFQDERAAPAVLTFLRETKVGRGTVPATLGGGKREWGEVMKREEGGPNPP